jgi:hypothetical protein
MTLATPSAAPAAVQRASGRTFLWLGILLALLGPIAYIVQLSLKQLKVPWYLPVVGTLAAGLLLWSLWRKRSVWRFLALGLVGLLATFEWWVVLSLTKLPAYTGPVAAGQAFPAFTAMGADGSSFTQEHFKGDKRTVLVFFRGRW